LAIFVYKTKTAYAGTTCLIFFPLFVSKTSKLALESIDKKGYKMWFQLRAAISLRTAGNYPFRPEI